MADGAGRKAEFTMSRTDKTRPHWVKLLDNPRNYREVHDHAQRPLRDENGEYVRVDTGKVWKDRNGKEHAIREIVYVPATECDLPATPEQQYKEDGKWWDGCHYDHTLAWISSGEARCGCPMCSGSEYFKEQNRRERYKGRRECRDWDAGY